MNIYAISGHKVKVTEKTKNSGRPCDKKNVEDFLEIEKEYTVKYTTVLGSRTIVRLREVPGVVFNSASFEDVSKQSIEDDRLHDDWLYYNS